MKNNSQCQEIYVIIAHPWGDIKAPLQMWMETGPGPRKHTRPVKVICADGTGTPLPMSTIPLRYRNNFLSQFLIKIGVLDNPWEKSNS